MQENIHICELILNILTDIMDHDWKEILLT